MAASGKDVKRSAARAASRLPRARTDPLRIQAAVSNGGVERHLYSPHRAGRNLARREWSGCPGKAMQFPFAPGHDQVKRPGCGEVDPLARPSRKRDPRAGLAV